MEPSGWVRYRGLAVALVGFGITRLLVAEALRPDATAAFLLAGLPPLVVGLGVTAFGVALAVGEFSDAYVATVTRWCLAGTAAMVAALGLTALGGLLRGEGMAVLGEAGLLVGNVLLGGAVGGLLIGDRSAASRRRRREIRRRANRERLVNRLLRHEVLNAATVVDGYAALLSDPEAADPEAVASIRAAAARIRSTVDDVGTIGRDHEPTEGVDVAAVVAREAERFEADADVEVAVRAADGPTEAVADDRLGIVVRELLEHAADRAGTARVRVGIEADAHVVRLTVDDDGPALPAAQRALLESGEFPDHDDPGTGFGLGIVRLLVAGFDGRIRVDDGIAVELPRHGVTDRPADAIGVTFPNLSRAVAAGLLAGVAMGAYFQLATGLLPVIGALYGVESPVVGWVTHLFHSVVFAVLFAAGCARTALGEYAAAPAPAGALGVVWGLTLWLVAAGLVMPAWLSLVGVPTALPNLSGAGFVGHALWGGVLGVTYRGLAAVEFRPSLPTRS